MMLKKSQCKNHPAELASKRCHYCNEYICKACQHVYRHHIYCGIVCACKDYFAEKYNAVSNEFKLLLIVIIATNLITFLLLKNNADEKVEDLNQSALMERVSPVYQVDTLFDDLQNYVMIFGRTNQESIMLLERDGHYVASVLNEPGYYEFPKQELFYGKNTFSVYGSVQPGILTQIDTFTIQYSSKKILSRARSVDRVVTNARVCALTFDAGSEAVGADSILLILKEKNIRVTIFFTGAFIKHYPQLVNQIVLEGHECANHTFSHPHLTSYADNRIHLLKDGVDRSFIRNQLVRTDSLFFELTGRNVTRFWRAPYGEYNNEILLWAAEAGYMHVGWSRGADTRDWISNPDDPLYLTAQQIKNRLLTLAENEKLNGSIVLMHLNSARIQDPVYRILGDLIDLLHEKGYEFMTVSQLLHLRYTS